jgi:hypothetical protein
MWVDADDLTVVTNNAAEERRIGAVIDADLDDAAASLRMPGETTALGRGRLGCRGAKAEPRQQPVRNAASDHAE